MDLWAKATHVEKDTVAEIISPPISSTIVVCARFKIKRQKLVLLNWGKHSFGFQTHFGSRAAGKENPRLQLKAVGWD